MMRRLQIDLNRRNAAGQMPADYFGPEPRVGETIIAFEPEDGVRVDAVVVAVDTDRRRVLLDVDWDSIRDDVSVWSRISDSRTSHADETGGGHPGLELAYRGPLQAAV